MSTHLPPTNDVERLANVLAAWCTPDNDAYESEEELRAEAAASAIDFDRWSATVRGWIDTRAAAERRPTPSAPPVADPTDADAVLRAEVERAVRPYEGLGLPPFIMAKLRELAERYWREHPQAKAAMRIMTREVPVHSERRVVKELSREDEGEDDEALGGKK